MLPLRESSQAQKSKCAVGLVATDVPPTEQQAPSMATWPPTLTHNLQLLPSPITPSHPSPESSSFPAAPEHFQPPQLVLLKGFVHEVLRRSRMSGTVLQTALCYLEAIRANVPELVEKKNGTGVQGEVDISHRIVQGNLEAEEWRELALDSVVADFIHLDAAVDHGAMPMMKAPEQQVAVHPVSVLAPTLTTAGLKSHVAQQNLVKKPKVPSGLLPPMPLSPSPLLCPRRTFLASLILALKLTQDRSYSNKAWAKLSGLPPHEIGRCKHALGNALNWHLWVGKAPASNTRHVGRTQSDGDLFASGRESATAVPSCGAGLRRSATVPASAFGRLCWRPHTGRASAAMGRMLTCRTTPRLTWTGPGLAFPMYTHGPDASSFATAHQCCAMGVLDAAADCRRARETGWQ
ncbi:hypothetical protein HWV62_39830 [Athelia sp. TMB]|nr:hypothetical protein HWV62_39830 [Athelia sp. TMB]